MIGEVLEDAAVTVLIGACKSRFCHLFANTEVVTFRPMRIQVYYQVTQAYAIRTLSEHHCKQLVPACEVFHIVITLVLANEVIEMISVKE